jgi:integrase
MATITKRKRKNGEFSYTAQIRIKKNGVIVYQEARTFDRQALAKAWSAKRELELQEKEVYGEQKTVLIKDLIQTYLDRFGQNYGRSKNYDLNRLLAYEIANINAYQLQAKHIIQHCIERNKEAKPQTVHNDVIWLRTVMRTMCDVDGHSYNMDVFDSVTLALKREKLIGKSTRRDRRPTKAELWQLSRYFARQKWSVPMLRIMWFAIYSARRDGEICRLLWSDNDTDKRTGMVRDLKHPTHKEGNHRRFKYPLSAWKIIQKQSKTDVRIFPYSERTVSAYFARACKVLGIVDLKFHDLRHEAVSRLFEKGLHIQQVQLISLHENWATLKRYTNLQPGDLDI